MRQSLLLAGIAAVTYFSSLHAAPKSSSVTCSGGDGSSFERAIIVNAPTEQTGVPAEYAYIARRYTGYHRGSQSLVSHGKRAFDILEFTTKDGKKKTLYFDITSFLGKIGH